jgi:hypothetical protein
VSPASDRPQKRQNWAPVSYAPRQRGQKRWPGREETACPTSMTRAGAIGAALLSGSGSFAIDFEVSESVRINSIAPTCPPPPSSAATSGLPQAMQKRRPGSLLAPHVMHATIARAPELAGSRATVDAPACAAALPSDDAVAAGRLANDTSGARGRALLCEAGGGPGATTGDDAVAARGEVGGTVPAVDPSVATRAASR